MVLKYFDSLVHVTTDGKWFHTACDASIENLLRSLEEEPSSLACVVGIAGYNMANDHILEVCQNSQGRLVPIAGMNPHEISSQKDATERMAGLAGGGFRGVKLHSRFNGFDLADPQVDWIMEAAAGASMAVFLCTLLRGNGRIPSASPPDLVHALLSRHPATATVLLHGGCTELLTFSDIVRCAPRALLDLSFTLLRYAGSSLDEDIRFVFRTLDRRCTIGSDFPEYLPGQARRRALELCDGLPEHKLQNIFYKNLAAIVAREHLDAEEV